MFIYEFLSEGVGQFSFRSFAPIAPRTTPATIVSPTIPEVQDYSGSVWNVAIYETGVPKIGPDGKSPRTHILAQFALAGSLTMNQALDIANQVCWLAQRGHFRGVDGGQIAIEVINWSQATGVNVRHICGPSTVPQPIKGSYRGGSVFNPRTGSFVQTTNSRATI
jgi:hypothetical protein